MCPERQIVCKDCNAVFRSPGLLRTHRLTQHPRPDETAEQLEDPTKTHHCKKCGQGFEAESELLAHQEKYPEGQQCNGSASPIKKRGRPPKTEDPAGGEKKGKRRKKDEAEETAKASSTLEPAEEKGKTAGAKRGRPPKATPKSETEDVSAEDDPQGQAKEMKPKAELTPPRQHPCPECDLAFPGLVQLRAHKKEKHTPRKAHPCEECDESFARPEQLDAHMLRAHAVGRFACPTCGKSFSRERTLSAHQKTHPEEKPETPSAKR